MAIKKVSMSTVLVKELGDFSKYFTRRHGEDARTDAESKALLRGAKRAILWAMAQILSSDSAKSALRTEDIERLATAHEKLDYPLRSTDPRHAAIGVFDCYYHLGKLAESLVLPHCDEAQLAFFLTDEISKLEKNS